MKGICEKGFNKERDDILLIRVAEKASVVCCSGFLWKNILTDQI